MNNQDLQTRLDINLMSQLPTGGLTMFIKGWRLKATPSGRLYYQLAASARPINGTDCGLWATPKVSSGDYQYGKNGEKILNLRGQVALWATPAVRDYKDTGELEKSLVRKDGKLRNDTIGRQAYGSLPPTERHGSLNPQFPCWLMGIPSAWVLSMRQAMQSFRKSRQRGSGRTGRH